MENYITLIALFAGGYMLRRVPAFPRDAANSLNLFVIYVSLPAMVLYQIPSMHISAEMALPVAMPWLMVAASAAAVYALSRALGWDRKVTGTMLLLIPLGNTSFLGIPMIRGFLGERFISYAIIYDQFGTFLALSTYGAYVLAAYGEGARPELRTLMRKIITFPPFIALAVALSTRGLAYPPALVASLKTIAASLVPVVMVAIGFQFRLTVDRHHMAPLGAGLVMKLVLAPLLALGICLAIGAGGDAAMVSVFEAGMPPMVTAGALAIMGGLAGELAASLVGFGIILSFASLPALHWALRLLP